MVVIVCELCQVGSGSIAHYHGAPEVGAEDGGGLLGAYTVEEAQGRPSISRGLCRSRWCILQTMLFFLSSSTLEEVEARRGGVVLHFDLQRVDIMLLKSSRVC